MIDVPETQPRWRRSRQLTEVPGDLMTDESLDKQLDGAARHLQASVADTLNVEAGLGAVLKAHRETDRDRVTAPGRRTDDGRRCDLLVVQATDGSWSFHAPPLGSPGVRMTGDIAASLPSGSWRVPSERPLRPVARHQPRQRAL